MTALAIQLGALRFVAEREGDEIAIRIFAAPHAHDRGYLITPAEWQSLVDLKTVLEARERTIEELNAAIDAIRDELSASPLNVPTDEPAEKLAHHVFVLRMGLASCQERLDSVCERCQERCEHAAFPKAKP